MKAVDRDLIAQRAYEIWEQSGRPDGLDKEHWEQAEREILDATPPIQAAAAAKSGTEKKLSSTERETLADATAPEDLEQDAASRSARERPEARGEAARIR